MLNYIFIRVKAPEFLFEIGMELLPVKFPEQPSDRVAERQQLAELEIGFGSSVQRHKPHGFLLRLVD